MTDKYYRDDSFAEHKCCYDAAIVTDCDPDKDVFGRAKELVCECREEWIDIILKALNNLQD